MKRPIPILLVVTLAALGGCDQNKSGPVEPTAEPPVDPASVAAEPGPAPRVGEALFATAGPEAAVPTGTPTKVELAVTPSEGFKINTRYDWSFEFHPHPELELGTAKVASDAVVLDDARAKIPVEVTAKSAGEHTLEATGNFSVCNDDKCELYRDRAVTFTVSASDG